MVDSIRTMDEDRAPTGGMPLELDALLSPYREHKRLSVRVERLPHGARLSSGHNNGDGTWSLDRSDLEDILYLPPSGLDEPHSLSIRVISFDGDAATTLAQFDLPIYIAGAEDAGPAQEQATDEAGETNVVALSAGLSKARKRARVKFETKPLPEEAWTEIEPDGAASMTDKIALKSATSQVTALEGQVAELTKQLEKVAGDTAAIEQKHADELETRQKRHAEALKKQTARAEEAFAQEMERRLKEARAEWEEARSKWEAEQALTRQKMSEAKAGKASQAIEEAVAKARKAWEQEAKESLAEAAAAADTRLEEARAEWQAEANAALGAAKDAWQAEEAERLAAAETHWRAQANRDLADVTARYKKAEAALVEAHKQALEKPDANKDAELHRLRDTLAATQAELTDREEALADMRKEIERAKKDKAGQDSKALENALVQARKDWEREWKEREAEAAAEAEVNLEKAQAAWQKEMDDRLAKAAERTEEQLDEVHQRRQEEADAVLSEEKAAWEAEEAARLAEAEARWKKQSAKDLAEATARLEKAEAALAEARSESEAEHESKDAELTRLQDEVSSAKAELAESNDELGDLRAQLKAADKRARKDLDKEVDAAVKSKDAELTRLQEEVSSANSALAESSDELDDLRAQLKAADKQARKDLDKEVDAAVKKAREAWKAEASTPSSSERDPDDVAELARLRDEIEKTKASLSESDDELAELRAKLKVTQKRAREDLEDEIEAAVQKAREAWKAEADTRSSPTRDPDDVAELRRLRDEIDSTKASLAESNSEMAELRAKLKGASERNREFLEEEIQAAVQEAREAWKEEEGKRIWLARIQWRKEEKSAQARAAVTKLAMTPRRGPILRYLVRGGLAVAGLVVAILLYPHVAPLITDTLWPGLIRLSSKVGLAFHDLLS